MLMNQSLGMGFVIMKQLHMFVPMMMVIVQVRNIEELNNTPELGSFVLCEL